PQGPVDPPADVGRKLALRRGASPRGASARQRRPAAAARAAGREVVRRRCARSLMARGVYTAPSRAGPTAGEIPVAAPALLPGGAVARPGGAQARLVDERRPRPARTGARPAALPAFPTPPGAPRGGCVTPGWG